MMPRPQTGSDNMRNTITKISVIAIAVCAGLLGGCGQHTSWLDHEPNIAIGAPGDAPDKRIQLGLRSDGVVVWRVGYVKPESR